MIIKYILLLNFAIIPANSDCGCNKLNRNDIKKDEKAFIEVESKVCQKDQVRSNGQYRDYYAEPEVKGMSLIPGGKYLIGSNEPHFESDKESPERLIDIKDFYLDKYEVSNKEFKKFVTARNFTTEAEKFGDSFLFESLLTDEKQNELRDFRVVGAEWWYKVKGVSWRKPLGPNSNLKGLWNHPAVHVSWNDARAFCEWAGKRLPTEQEWEVACRGGKKRKLFPWGNKLRPKNEHWLNIWQGIFPENNTEEDGYAFTCPVDKFRQNTYDLYNIVGNVWEWVSDLWYPNDNSVNPSRVKKGGSYLCHKSYCYRYRCAARSQNTADSSAGNLGFRCAKDL